MSAAKKFAHIKTHTIRGKVYRLVWRKPRGRHPDPTQEYVAECETPRGRGKSLLWIWPRQDPEDMLFTVIHEITHGAFWDLEEKAIEEFERDCRKFLKRMKMKVSFE